MAARPNRPQLAAVDANVLFDLADGLEDVIDALSVIRARLPDARFLIPPTEKVSVNSIVVFVIQGVPLVSRP